MNTTSTNSANKISRVAKITKTRLSIITLFVLLAVFSTAVFSATTSASSLDEFFENNLPAPIASSLSSVSHAFFGTTSTANSTVTMTATVTTDKNDYAPGETAIITGTGFGAVETVTLHVEHLDGTEPGGGGHEPWTAVTDANGNFTTTWYVNPDDSLGSTFLLTAVGGTSGLRAETTFTDGNVKVYATSGNITTPTTATVDIAKYINGACTGTLATVNNNSQSNLPISNTSPQSDAVTSRVGSVKFTASLSGTVNGISKNFIQWRSDRDDDTFIYLDVNGNPSNTVTTSICFSDASTRSHPFYADYGTKAPTATTLTVSPATGQFGGTVTLTAKSTAGGVNVSNQTVNFKINGKSVGGAVTAVNGEATITGVALTDANGMNIPVGTYPGYITAVSVDNTDFYGATGSNTLTVTAPAATAPEITNQPANQTTCVDGSATFSVTASGTSPTYQWRKGSVNISGANSSSYTISPVSAANAASYDVVVSNSAGTVTSNAATLTVNTPPSITGQPQGATKTFGESITFSVAASGTNPTYQWFKGDPTVATNAINDATNSTYTISSVAVANAGDYYVVVSGTCSPSVTSNKATLAVNKATATVSLNNPTFIYDGTAKSATATTTPAGLTVDLVYSQNNTPVAAPTNAGDYAVTATINDANYQGSTTGTLKINKATPTVTFTSTAPSTLAYNGTYTPAANTNGDGTFSFSASGACSLSSGVVTINAGSGVCTVTASVAVGANYTSGSASQTINATKASASVTLNNLSQTYDGSPKSAGYTTNPADLAVSLTYSQNNLPVVAPTNAGSYAVVAAINNANYEGSTSGTLVIGKAASSVTFTSTAPANLAYNGTYTPTANTTGDGTLTIGVANGGACVISGGIVTITSGSGTCAVTASVSEGSNYLGSSATPQTIIAIKANQTITFTGAPVNATYNTTFNVSVSASSSLSVTVGATAGVCSINSSGVVTMLSGTGVCTLTASQAGDGNYNPATNVTQTTTAQKATATFSAINLTQTYDGSPKAATVSVTTSGLAFTVTYVGTGATTYPASTTPPTSAGTYSITATIVAPDANNYQGSGTEVFTINKADQTIAWENPASIVYGTALSNTQLNASVSGITGGSAPGALTYSPVSGTILNAGARTLSVTAAATANYNVATKNVTVTVNPANTATSVSNASASFGSSSVTLGASVTNASTTAPVNEGTVTFTVKSGSISIGTAIVAVSNNAASAMLNLSADYTLGTYSIEAVYTNSANPANFNGSSDATPGTLTIGAAGTTTTVSVNPASVQYSDTVTLSANVSPASLNGQTLTGTVQFFIDGNSVGSAAAVSAGTASLTFNNSLAPKGYKVTAQFTSTNINFSGSSSGVPANSNLTITQEDARATYTGALFASTSSATSSSATVTLSATIQDITAVSGDPAYDANAGDIRNAKVTFALYDNGIYTNIPNCIDLTVGLVDAADTKTGTATCNWAANIGNTNSAIYTVATIVTHYYTRKSPTEFASVTVSKPIGTAFITGGGYLLLTDSAGIKAGDDGTKNNFGFNVKYNNSGTNLQGNINTIIRRTENGVLRVFQIKGNVMTSLSVRQGTSAGCPNATSTNPCTAIFNGRANIQDITNPQSPVSVDGNATLQVTMTDKGEPGSADKIGITVWNKDGGLWFSSNWSSTSTIEQLLGNGNPVGNGSNGGNLVVH